MNFGELRTKFLARLNRRDCTNALADGFLQDAITRSQRLLRIPALERGVSITIDADTYLTNGYLPIPADFLKIIDLSVTLADGRKRSLTRKSLSEVQQGITTQDYPRIFARQGAGYVLAPTPLATQVIRLDYWAESTTLDDDSDDNILIDVASDLIVFGALSYACDHWSDKRGDKFEGRYTQIISDIQAMADQDELSGNAAVQAAFYYPDDEG